MRYNRHLVVYLMAHVMLMGEISEPISENGQKKKGRTPEP